MYFYVGFEIPSCPYSVVFTLADLALRSFQTFLRNVPCVAHVQQIHFPGHFVYVGRHGPGDLSGDLFYVGRPGPGDLSGVFLTGILPCVCTRDIFRCGFVAFFGAEGGARGEGGEAGAEKL